MKNRLYVFPLARYMLLGITLFLIILMIKGGAEDYSYLNTLEARLPNDPVRVYEELCVYQDKYKFKSNNEQSYFWLLLYKSKKGNNLQLPPDSTLINLANRCGERGDMLLYIDCIRLLGDISLERNEIESALGYYNDALLSERALYLTVEKKRSIEHLFGLFAIIISSAFFVCYLVISRKYQTELERKRRMQLFVQKKYESSKQYIDDNLKVIDLLTERLNSTSNLLKQQDAELMQLQRNNLEIKNKEQEIKRNRISTSLSLIEKSEQAAKFYKASSNSKVVITKDDWAKYSELISNEFPLLMEKLNLISNLTSTERKVCLLMLLDDIGTLEMSTILKLKSSSISSAKKDLYEKLTGLKGSAKNLSQEIINIITFPL